MQTVLHGAETQLAVPDKLSALWHSRDKNGGHVKHAVGEFRCGEIMNLHEFTEQVNGH